MAYVDGFLLPFSADKRDQYADIARKVGEIWIKHGALQYWESLLEDTTEQDFCTSFPAIIKPEAGETIAFAFVTFRDRAHRDEVNAKVMADPEMDPAAWDGEMPFDCARMAWNGFESVVALGGPASDD
ncbi:MAG: DUF1428 domain-containing protein [Alphaproteobacteria bacterium]